MLKRNLSTADKLNHYDIDKNYNFLTNITVPLYHMLYQTPFRAKRREINFILFSPTLVCNC